MPSEVEATCKLKNNRDQQAMVGILRFAKDGGDAGTSFELCGLLSQDVMIMAKKFVELEYSLDCLTTLLNGELEEKGNLIL